ncbi:hypothetical protein EW026_g538 [Hermanssonia centrifuga]|uniref:Uncharacterized protein n=1 Tax=Hermanssonia centrifuga TaxID=98765 RepID=A0A4S4KYS2_9APHY|nr:hypothetical protein EW026_g538 [Hermanssonia centrifuga]
MPHNQIYNALYWNLPTGTLYLNALLATLNARQKLRKSFDDHKAATLPVISILASMASGAGITPISLGQLTQSYNQNYKQPDREGIVLSHYCVFALIHPISSRKMLDTLFKTFTTVTELPKALDNPMDDGSLGLPLRTESEQAQTTIYNTQTVFS